MTGEILNSIVTKLNRQLSSKERNIMLFLDNAGCHPGELAGKYSNIKVCFLPANTSLARARLSERESGTLQ